MFDTVRRLNDLLTAKEKVALGVLGLIMIFEALLEMVGVAVIPAFIALLSQTEGSSSNAISGVLEFVSIDQSNRTEVIVWASLLLFAFYVAKAGFVSWATYWKVRFVYNRVKKLSTRLYGAYLEAPYLFHLRHGTAELFRNVDTECLNLAQKVLLPAIQVVSQTVVLVGIVIVLLLLVPPMALMWLFGFVAAGLVAASLLQSRSKELGAEAQRHRRDTAKSIHEGLHGAKEIKLLQRVPWFVDRFADQLGSLLSIQRKHGVINQSIPGAIETLGIAGLLGVTAVLVWQDVPPDELVALLAVFAVGLTRLKGAVRVGMTSLHELRHNSPSLTAVHDALTELETLPAPSLELAPSGVRTDGGFNSLKVDSVSFSYPDAPVAALDRVSLTLQSGTAVGLVGPSGSGKSTLLDVLMGVLTPTAGRVVADGEDILSDLRSWQKSIGYVPQNLFLIDGTIRDNVALGLPSDLIDESSVVRAIEAADLMSLVNRQPMGLDTTVGENGLKLSGGERQRLVIARALYGNPDVLMMDEATASLDNTTEQAVVEAIDRLKGKRTIVMIAHRLTTVRKCDQLIFMKDGKVNAVGSYDELVDTHDEFRRMAVS